jgi:hypothetical protein
MKLNDPNFSEEQIIHLLIPTSNTWNKFAVYQTYKQNFNLWFNLYNFYNHLNQLKLIFLKQSSIYCANRIIVGLNDIYFCYIFFILLTNLVFINFLLFIPMIQEVIIMLVILIQQSFKDFMIFKDFC